MTYLCDTNVWLALLISGHAHHTSCTRWFDTNVTAGEAIMVRPVQVSVARLLTTDAVLRPFGRAALSNGEAGRILDDVLADRRVMLAVDEPPRLGEVWRQTSTRPTSSPKLWMDAFLAAWAIGAGWSLATTDRAFTQFGGLDVVDLSNPTPRPPGAA